MFEILNVRKTLSGYMINGIHEVDFNNLQIVEWLSEGKEVLPLLTDEEINKIQIQILISEKLDFLSRTDHKELPHYEPSLDENILEIIQQRIDARRFIREHKQWM